MIVVGSTVVYRLRLDRDAGRIVVDERWRPRYGPAPDRSFGWDPVITDRHVFWMDNGRNDVDRTMLGAGEQPGPVRLWWAAHDDDAARSVEISGLPHGTESNPPGWDPERGIVIAYDAGNAVLRAWRVEGDELEPLWRRDGFAHAGHLIVYPDTRELVVAGLERQRGAAAAAGAPRAAAGLPGARRAPPPPAGHRSRRAATSSWCSTSTPARTRRGSRCRRPRQAFLFPAPGFGRDLYYQSLTTIARVVVA